MEIYKGNFIFTKDKDDFSVIEKGYAVVCDGIIKDLFNELPSEYASCKIKDFGENLVIPSFIDLHLHAPQYENIGLGLDKKLLDWLETYTFPEESKFKDNDYAKGVYSLFVNDLKTSGTTRACVFATVHREATDILFELFYKEGLQAFIGKSNMDTNCDKNLQETTENGKDDISYFIEKWQDKSVKPIITPRFAPVCSEELMEFMGQMAKKHSVAIQTHISESPGEIEYVKSLFPDYKNYADVYDKFGLLGEKTILAHCIYNNDEEIEIFKQRGIYVAHCPASNMDLISGIAPIRKYLDLGIKVGLGSDISGGHSVFMPRSIVSAIESSKIYNIYIDESKNPLSLSEAFYLATKGGGSFFGNVGSFEVGFEFDALVIDDFNIRGFNKRNLKDRLAKFIYNGSKENIKEIYVCGEKIN